MAAPWESAVAPAEPPPAGSAAGGAPWEAQPPARMTDFGVKPYSPKQYSIDFNRPEEEVRAQIRTLDPEQREMALRDWADVVVTKEHQESPIFQGINDRVRAVARGVPILGAFSDEAAAALTPGAGGDYDERLAYQRGKDRYYDKSEKAGSIGWKMLGGVGTYGSAAGPLLGTNLPASGQVAADIGTGYISGFGEGEGDLANRMKSGTKDAALSGVLSGAFQLPGAIARPFRDVPENLDIPTVNAAAEVNANLPFFARARPDQYGNSTAARWAARLQGMPIVGDPISAGYAGGQTSVANSIADAATGAAQVADVRSAPSATGTVARQGMTDASEALRQQVTDVSQSLEGQFGPGAFDLQQTRDLATTLADARTAAPGVADSPLLTRTVADLQAPVTYPAAHQARGHLGAQIGVPRAGEMIGIEDRELNALYQAYTSDLANQASVTGIRPQFDTAQTVIRELSDTRRELQDALSGDPSNLISRLTNWGSAKGSGINETAFNTVVSSLSPEQRQQVAGGVLAHVYNVTNGSPQRVAQWLSTIPENLRTNLFEASGLPVNSIQTLGETLQRVNQGRNWSGTAGSSAAIDTILKTGAPLLAVGNLLHGGSLGDVLSSAATAATPFVVGPTAGRALVEGIPATPGLDAAAQALLPAAAQAGGRWASGTQDPRLRRGPR
jgi:hypothetical protein